LRVVPAADGGGGLLEAVVMSARRHPRFTDHVGLTSLGGKSVAGLALGLAETLGELVASGDAVLAGGLAGSGLTAQQVHGALLEGAGWHGSVSEVVAWLVANRFGVSVRTVETGGDWSVFGQGGVEVVVVRESTGGGDGYSATEPIALAHPRLAETAPVRAGVKRVREADSEEAPPAPKRRRTDIDRDVANVVHDSNPPSGDVANGPGHDSDVEMTGAVDRTAAPRGVDGEGANADGGSKPIEQVLKPPVPVALVRVVASRNLKIKRSAFSSATDAEMPPQYGLNRRHIVPSHAFKEALNAWLDAHFPDGDQQRVLAHAYLQAWQNAVDNHGRTCGWVRPWTTRRPAGCGTTSMRRASRSSGSGCRALMPRRR
jgi:hypothetical protein